MATGLPKHLFYVSESEVARFRMERNDLNNAPRGPWTMSRATWTPNTITPAFSIRQVTEDGVKYYEFSTWNSNDSERPIFKIISNGEEDPEFVDFRNEDGQTYTRTRVSQFLREIPVNQNEK